MSIKYVVHPGFVESQNDGDRHFVDAPTLMRLYNLTIYLISSLDFEETMSDKIDIQDVREYQELKALLEFVKAWRNK